METPNMNADRYVWPNSLRDTHSQSVQLDRTTLPCKGNTDSGAQKSSEEENKYNFSSNSMSKSPEDSKEKESKGTLSHWHFLGEEDSAENFKSAPKNAYSPKVTKILMKWLKNNIYYPYPSEDERIRLWRETGLSRKQLRVWLINTRKVSFSKLHFPNFLPGCLPKWQESHAGF